MGHIAVAILLIMISHRIHNICADLSVPFTHDFNTSLHGWHVGEKFWHWTGQSNLIPNTTNIPFDSDGNYIWTKKSCLVARRAFRNQLFYSQFVTNVTKNSRFHLQYWYNANDSECGFLSFSLLNKQRRSRVTKTITHNSSNGWDDVTIDCQIDNCCKEYNCDLRLFISGSVGCSNSEDLIMIRSVSATIVDDETPTVNFNLTNRTSEKPESDTTTEHPDNYSSSIASWISTMTSPGSTNSPHKISNHCQQNQLNKHKHAMHSLNSETTRHYSSNSARTSPLNDAIPTIDPRLAKLMLDIENEIIRKQKYDQDQLPRKLQTNRRKRNKSGCRETCSIATSGSGRHI